ncbi:hypothetical protein QT979_15415 [Microcoleus sp. w2-18bC1]|uniref:hypothetical protein n=1 Tax=unclassified Microcoleus TaxID=2642155 RepID=UPI002FD31405
MRVRFSPRPLLEKLNKFRVPDDKSGTLNLYWASGIGHRASGIGHRASGIGHRELVTTVNSQPLTVNKFYG